MTDSIFFTSTRAVTQKGMGPYAVEVSGEKIRSLCLKKDIPPGSEVLDFGDRVLLPGLVDSHVHVNEPGRTEWEGFRTATQAAAAGGITTVVDMPLNCTPVTTSLEALETKLEALGDQLSVDCGFFGGVIPGNSSKFRGMAERGILGAKAFLVHSGIDDFPKTPLDELERAMAELARLGIPLLVHAELEDSSVASDEDGPSYSEYLNSRPPEWEERAIHATLQRAKKTGCSVHIVHLSAASALPIIAEAKLDGVNVTVETCPHYLVFCAEEIPPKATEFKCAPPIRSRENRKALWQAVLEGKIDFIVSDHSPCTPNLKCRESGDFGKAWGGIASLQLGLSSIWTEGKPQGLTIEQLADVLCRNPARFLGLSKKGEIAPGFDADLVVWNPEGSFEVTEKMLLHKHKLSPYLHRKLQGVVEKTFLRGRCIYSEGKIIAPSLGRPILGRNHVH